MRTTLVNIAHKLNKENIPWLLAGKTAAILQGCFLHSNTLTFYTNQKGAYNFGDYFVEFKREKIKFRKKSNIVGHTGLYLFNDIEVRVIGDPEIIMDQKHFPVPLDQIFLETEPTQINEEMIPLLPLPWLFVLGALGGDVQLVQAVGESNIEKASILNAANIIGANYYITAHLDRIFSSS